MSTNSDTPTPRTDKWEYEQECNYEVAWEDNCRQLERELAESQEDAKAHKQMLQNLSKTHALERVELDRRFQFITKQRDAFADWQGAFELAVKKSRAATKGDSDS